MKRIATKLTSKKGETLVEILVAVLIIAIAAGLFAGLYAAAMNINLSARKTDKSFYAAVGELESKIGSGEGEEGGTLHYVPMEKGKEVTDQQQGIHVNVDTQDGLNIYNDDKSGGTSGSASGGTSGGMGAEGGDA